MKDVIIDISLDGAKQDLFDGFCKDMNEVAVSVEGRAGQSHCLCSRAGRICSGI